MVVDNIKFIIKEIPDSPPGEERPPGQIGEERLDLARPGGDPMDGDARVMGIVALPGVLNLIGVGLAGADHIHPVAIPGQEIGQMIDMETAPPGMERRIE
jgi:hypothetical protein